MRDQPLWWWLAISAATLASLIAGEIARASRRAYLRDVGCLGDLPGHFDRRVRALERLSAHTRTAQTITVVSGTVTVVCAVVLVAGYLT